MTIEKSNGKPRPTLPRASDARKPETDSKPTAERDAHGHFSAGNRTAVGSGLIHTTKKLTGTKEATGDARIVARDARRVAAHIIRAFPSDAAPVRVLVALHARHVALNAFFTAKAEEAGLDTVRGLEEFLTVAGRESQRAERTLVTAQDMARVCATNDAKQKSKTPAWLVSADDPDASGANE